MMEDYNSAWFCTHKHKRTQKIPVCTQKSHICTQKSPVCTQKSPICTQKSSRCLTWWRTTTALELSPNTNMCTELPCRCRSFCVTLLIHVCDMTRSHVWHDSFILCDMTHSHVRHDSFTRVTWRVHSVWHDSFTCVIRLIHMCDMTRSFCVTRLIHMCGWLIYMCGVTHANVCHASHSCKWHDSLTESTCQTNIKTNIGTPFPRCCSSFCVTWLVHMCDMTYPLV